MRQRSHLSLKKYSFARLLLFRASTVMLSMCGENLHAGTEVSNSRSAHSTVAHMHFKGRVNQRRQSLQRKGALDAASSAHVIANCKGSSQAPVSLCNAEAFHHSASSLILRYGLSHDQHHHINPFGKPRRLLIRASSASPCTCPPPGHDCAGCADGA